MNEIEREVYDYTDPAAIKVDLMRGCLVWQHAQSDAERRDALCLIISAAAGALMRDQFTFDGARQLTELMAALQDLNAGAVPSLLTPAERPAGRPTKGTYTAVTRAKIAAAMSVLMIDETYRKPHQAAVYIGHRIGQPAKEIISTRKRVMAGREGQNATVLNETQMRSHLESGLAPRAGCDAILGGL